MNKPPKPLLMTEEYWANSQLSIARYYGALRISNYNYDISAGKPTILMMG